MPLANFRKIVSSCAKTYADLRIYRELINSKHVYISIDKTTVESYKGGKRVKTLNPLAPALQGLERRLLTTVVTVSSDLYIN